MKIMHLRDHEQAPMEHRGKIDKHRINGNRTSKMRLGEPTEVTASRVTIQTQGQTDQSVIQNCKILC